MNIAISGGGGFLGRRLAEALLADPRVDRLFLADIAPIQGFPKDRRLVLATVDLSDPNGAKAVVEGADVIFHLAAVVSGQAEAEFEFGMRVNLDSTRGLLEAARSEGRCPRFVFASSLAVFGPPMPAVVTEDTAVHPQSSYGTQKAIGELLVSDYSRRGFVDGRVMRLPTVCVRPGRPNAAASSFVSGIIREPIHGEKAVCPVGPDQELWLSSPHTAVENLVHGASLKAEALGSQRIINVPGITVTVAEMIAALERVAGAEVSGRVNFGEAPAVRRIVSSWPARFDVSRAIGLGFSRDAGFESLVRRFIADEASEKSLRRP
jgi:nucleoside-diphosphate-sugar epimerase